MDLSFFPLTLEAVDAAAAESRCLFIASDERPLTGLSGLADWRLAGRLSRLVRSGLLTGEAGEAVLTPPGSRLGFQKLFLFGVGPSEQAEEKLLEQISAAMRKLSQAGVQEAAMQLPARLSADTGIRALVDEAEGPARAMVFGADPQKLVVALSHAARGQRVSTPPPAAVKSPVPPPVAVKPAPPPPPVTPALQPRPPPAAALPKASPLSFAPQGGPPVAQFTPPPPPAIPAPSPLNFAPSPLQAVVAPPPRPPPATAAPEPPVKAPEPPAAVEERKPIPPPPQRYVPPPPKPHVFEKGKRRKKP